MNKTEAFEKWYKQAEFDFITSRDTFFAGWEAAEKQRNQSCLCDKCHEVACECNEQEGEWTGL